MIHAVFLMACAGVQASAQPLPTVFIIGDSTACNGQDLGWGSHLGKYFDPNKVHIIADQCELMGPIRVAAFFPRDHTHTSAEGANLNAALVVSGLKSLKNCPLAAMLSAEGQAVTPAGENVTVEQTQDLLTKPWMPEALPVSDPNLPTLFLIGDSTVRTGRLGSGELGQWGWGAPLGELFDRTKINVENRAMGGTSSRTFQTQGLWDDVLARMKKGDFLILQFGHNDSSPINDKQRARGTIRGLGEETEEIDNLLTSKHETVHTYGWYLRKVINDAKAKGVTAIVCSPIPRNNWQQDKVVRASQDYALWAAEVAKAEAVSFIDLNELIARRYEAMGQAKVTALCFPPNERTHTGPVGAQLNATCVVEGLRSLEGCPLVPYLKPANRY
jgi:lysophospholipase L1-like esterase